MKEPRDDRKATVDERVDAPEFDALTPPEELVRGDRTRDDFFDAVLGLDSPATVDEVADRADHGSDAAREYLNWFEGMGIVTRVTDSPRTYKRNPEYFAWRRVQQLREQYGTDELLSLLETETERDSEYRETFDATSPTAVSVSGQAVDTDRSVESVWSDLSAWQTTRQRIDLLERALRTTGESVDQRSAV